MRKGRPVSRCDSAQVRSSRGSGCASGIARLGAAKPQTPALDPLFQVIRANHPKADLSLIERAYRTAERYHRGQTAASSGDAYITHPLAVTTILAELGMTEATLCAALLHDTVEDTAYTLAALTRDFGEEVALLVDGCTKLDKIKYGESAKSDTIRKMVVAMSRDIRVLVIKLADRLHNMRTLHYLRPDKQSPDRVGDAGDLRPAGPPAGHEHHQVGARGPRLRHHAPQGLRRDRPAGRRGGAQPGRVPLPGRSSR